MAKLIGNVYVGGEWYGPDYGNADAVPDDVAAEITNPGAWEGGEVPESGPKPLDKRTVKELRDMAAEAGIEVPEGAKKADLVALLEAAQAPGDGGADGGTPPDGSDSGD